MFKTIQNIIGKRRESQNLQSFVEHCELMSAEFINTVEEHNPIYIYPASYLPYPKDEIQMALEASLAANAKDEQKKEAYVFFLMKLPYYRERVSEPLSPTGLNEDEQCIQVSQMEMNEAKSRWRKINEDPETVMRRGEYQNLRDELLADLKTMQKRIEQILANLTA